MNSNDKPILVTGGAGYIGAHTCKRLAEDGWLPIAYDNLVYGHADAVQWGPLETADLMDEKRMDAVIERYRPAAVIHFAAYTYVGESVTDPGKYYHNNVCGSLALLRAMVRHTIKHVVFSSTCATYGEPEWTPITEDHPQNPVSPYGMSKLMVERMLADFEAAHGMTSAALRYFNAAGADPEAQIGEDHNPETHLIPIALDVAMGRRAELQIFGNDYDTPDGTCVRDYVHVTDLADAHLLALKHLLGGGESLRLNLGSGRGYSVQEVALEAEHVTGRAIDRRVVGRRAGDPPRLLGSSERAHKTLGWKPNFDALPIILRHAWAWHRKRFGGEK
jgi:UDP-arabinose 4-epimerase